MMREWMKLGLGLILTSVLAPLGRGEDWPTWRYDSRRSAASPEELPAQLYLQWMRELPPLVPAWPDESRMTFDHVYQPVTAGDLVFLGSSRDDSVTAYDAKSGAEVWRFVTEGPVRFAPVASEDKLFVGSDDGFLYCLNVRDGSLAWRFQPSPTEKKVLGNERLISLWPVRGGPVLSEGSLFFAAGMWSFTGVFIYALDPKTGQVQWSNTGSGSIYTLQPHNSPAFGGVAPQGYLAANKDDLFVPNGRAVAACLNSRTGQLVHFQLAPNGKLGNDTVVAMDGYFFNDGWMLDSARGEDLINLVDLPVVTDRALYLSTIKGLKAYEPRLQIKKKDDKDEAPEMILPELWQFADAMGSGLIKSGSRLYLGREKQVMAVDLPVAGGSPILSWTGSVEGFPASLVAANGRLFVTTREGRLYCFGGSVSPEPPKYSLAQPVEMALKTENRARAILKATGAKEGYGVLFGIGDGNLCETLARLSQLRLIAVDPDPDKVAKARKRMQEVGLYGSRVAIHQGDPSQFPWPPYLASLAVVEDAACLGSGPEGLAALFKVLRPYGGVACLFPSEQEKSCLSDRVKSLPGAQWTPGTEFCTLARPKGLPGAGQWTHQYGDPGNTCVSQDELVQAPLGVLWFGGSSNAKILPRHGHGPSEQVCQGRLFIEGPDTLRAVDVYTGRVLWEADLPGLGQAFINTDHQPGANALGTNYVTTPDGIYVAQGDACVVLDPETGKTLKRLALPPGPGKEGKQEVGYLAVWEDLLVVAASPMVFSGERQVGVKENWDRTCSKRLLVLDRHSGKVLWTYQAQRAFRHNAICVGGGKVFCIDRLPPGAIDELKRRGKEPDLSGHLLALDARKSSFDLGSLPDAFGSGLRRKGVVVWSSDKEVFGTWLGYSAKHDILLEAGRFSRDMLEDETKDRMATFRGKDGKSLWDKKTPYEGPCMIRDDVLITQNEAYSLMDGSPKMRKDPLTGEEIRWAYQRHHGCNTAIGSLNLITFRSAAAGFFDLKSDIGTGNLGGFRSGCTSNLIAADGVLNAPDYTRTCICRYPMQTSLALIHDPDAENWSFVEYPLPHAILQRVGVNLGAPGNRMSQDRTLWLDYPSAGGPSPEVSVTLDPEVPVIVRHQEGFMKGEGLKWVAGSGAVGLRSITLPLIPEDLNLGEKSYTVKLTFAELEGMKPGERIFDVALQGQDVLKGFDIAKDAGGPMIGVVKEFKGVKVQKDLKVSMASSSPKAGPLLCGVEAVLER